MLFKFRIADSPLCYFCNKEFERLEQFFFQCKIVSSFWNELNSILKLQKMISAPLESKDISFGIVHAISNSVLINYIIIEGKFFIYRSKLDKFPLSTSLFLEKCKRTYEIERYITRRNKKLFFRNKNGSLSSQFWNSSYQVLRVKGHQ